MRPDLANVRQVPRLLQPFAIKVPVESLMSRQQQDLTQDLVPAECLCRMDENRKSSSLYRRTSASLPPLTSHSVKICFVSGAWRAANASSSESA
jgi:hypothetical protein